MYSVLSAYLGTYQKYGQFCRYFVNENLLSDKVASETIYFWFVQK